VDGRAREEGDPAVLDETGGRGQDDRAEALARNAGAAAGAGFDPAEWAELLLFKAGLRADRGELGAADRLLGRAAKLFRSAGEPHRAGIALAEQGSIRAELGDRRRAAELLRAGIDLLDLAAAPRLVAATLCRLAELVGGVWPAGLDAALAGPDFVQAGADISAAGSSGARGVPGAPASAPAAPSGSCGPAGIPAAAAGSHAAQAGSTAPPMAADPTGSAAAQTGPSPGAGRWRSRRRSGSSTRRRPRCGRPWQPSPGTASDARRPERRRSWR